jgi:uncharacterized protein YdeI (YjbR/CyaY-like superfamily)
MAKHIDGIDLYYAKDTATWRKWLQKNSQHSKAVWLIYYKPAIGKTRENGAWDALNDVEEMLIPTDLLKALKKNKTAHDYFTSFPKSSKKSILEWIQNAKQEITRSRRIAETVKLARENIRANHYRQPKGSTKKLTT